MLRQVVQELPEVEENNHSSNGHSLNGDHKNGRIRSKSAGSDWPAAESLFPRNGRAVILHEHPVTTVALKVRQTLHQVIHSNLEEVGPMGFSTQARQPVNMDLLVELCETGIKELDPVVLAREHEASAVQFQVFANALQARLEELLIYLRTQSVSKGIAENSRLSVMRQLSGYKEIVSNMMIQLRAYTDGIEMQ